MGTNEDTGSSPAQFAYLDLLTTTLTEHEKNLDKLVRKLEKICDGLSKIESKTISKRSINVKSVPHKKESLETLIYMKMKMNRPSDELKLILNSLKE